MNLNFEISRVDRINLFILFCKPNRKENQVVLKSSCCSGTAVHLNKFIIISFTCIEDNVMLPISDVRDLVNI